MDVRFLGGPGDRHPAQERRRRLHRAEDELDRLEGEGLVAFRYLGVNPNGSLRDIAGIANERGNVVGLMPHPEHAVEPGFGPDTPHAMRSGVDGLAFFTSAIAAVVATAA